MPAKQSQLARFSTADLTDDERLSVKQAIVEEAASGYAPSDADLETALDALVGAQAKCRRIRAELANYESGVAVLQGGNRALTYEPVVARGVVRNALRTLLGFSAEPVVASMDSLQLVSLRLTSYGDCGEF